MTLEDLGFSFEMETYIQSAGMSDFSIGRIMAEHKERYIVKSDDGEFESEITGNMRYTASGRYDFPAVGDWVAFSAYDSNAGIIHRILPRKTILERQAIGKHGEKQIIATNIDMAFIIQSVDNNFNINRLERYMSICYASNIEAVLILSKTDLIAHEDIDAIIASLEKRGKKITSILLSNLTKKGYNHLGSYLQKGKTCCLIGSSGVGKSTLINNLAGKDLLKTSEISVSTNKGKHTTSHRELFILETGGILIDTPGMRELGMTDSADGIESTFETITRLSSQCRFNDCSHTTENGCAITEAVAGGKLSNETYDNFLRMQREQQWFETTMAEKRKKDKEFGKMIKSVLKRRKKNKF